MRPYRQARPKHRAALAEGLFIVRDAAVFLFAVVTIVLLAGLNGPRP